jgi:hypothetical protein
MEEKSMKKLFALTLVFVMVLSLAACGGKDKATSGKGDGKVVVGVVQTNANESDWRTANTKSFNEAFEKPALRPRWFSGKAIMQNRSHRLSSSFRKRLIIWLS